MDFSLNDDHRALRASARAFLEKECDLSPLLVPGATVAQAGYERLWEKIAALGWTGLIVPQEHGGLGLTCLDLVMIIGETGRTLAPSPLFGTLAGTWAVLAAGSDAQKGAILGEVAAGSVKLALAVADAWGNTSEPAAGVIANETGAGHELTGTKSFVVDAGHADKIVVAARLDGACRFFVVDRHATGVVVANLDWRDITRQVCSVSLSKTPALLLADGDAHSWPWIRDRLYLVLAAESAAGTRASLDDAVEYAKQRVAFGRPIGAFQAIKHQLAEVAGLAECASAGVEYAAWALGENDARGPIAAAMAQSYASEAYREATHRNIQVFGAIGFTWEMKNHLFYKRARCNAELLGAPAQQRAEILRILAARAS